MEFDNVFTAIQGRLISAQKKMDVKLVDVIKGHEGDLTILENSIKDLNLTEDCHRKVHLLFLLNSSFYTCDYLENDINFCHIINSIPKISDYIYLKLVTSLNWYKFFGEAILFCPEFLIYDVLKYVETNVKYLDSEKAIALIPVLYESLFKKTVITECKHRRLKMVKYFINLLKFDFELILNQTEWKKKTKHQYWGFVNRMYLEVTESSIRFMADPKVSKPDIYDFTVEYDYSKWPNLSSEPNWGKHCLGLLATKTAESLRKMCVNMFMSWCEVAINGSGSDKTLQTSVRETAYTCREAIKSMADCNSVAGLSMLDKTLENIAVRPITEDEEVAAADPDTLVINILNPKRTQVKWLKGLIERGIFENAPYMKVVTDNARLMDLDTCQLLLSKAVQYISSNSISDNDLTLIRETVFSCIRVLALADQIKLLDKYLMNYASSALLSSDDHQSNVTELLNKVVSDWINEEVLKDVVCLAFQNSEEFLSHCLRECLTSKQKCDIVIDLLEHIKPIFFTNCGGITLGLSQLTDLMLKFEKTNNDQQKDLYLNLMTSLCQKSLVCGKTVLNEYAAPIFETHISDKELTTLTYYLEIISALTKVENYSSVKLITLIAKALDRLRPKVTSFNMSAIYFTSACAKLLYSLVETYLNNTKLEEDSKVRYLREVAGCLSPLNSRYMVSLWSKWNKAAPLNHELPTVYWALFGLGRGAALTALDQKERFTIVSAIIKVLPVLTMTEWEEIGQDGAPADRRQYIQTMLAVFFVLADCILILFQLPFMVKNEACLGNTLTNFMHFTKVRILSIIVDEVDEEVRITIQKKVEQISSQLPQSLVKSRMPQLVWLQRNVSGQQESSVQATQLLRTL